MPDTTNPTTGTEETPGLTWDQDTRALALALAAESLVKSTRQGAFTGLPADVAGTPEQRADALVLLAEWIITGQRLLPLEVSDDGTASVPLLRLPMLADTSVTMIETDPAEEARDD